MNRRAETFVEAKGIEDRNMVKGTWIGGGGDTVEQNEMRDVEKRRTNGRVVKRR